MVPTTRRPVTTPEVSPAPPSHQLCKRASQCRKYRKISMSVFCFSERGLGLVSNVSKFSKPAQQQEGRQPGTASCRRTRRDDVAAGVGLTCGLHCRLARGLSFVGTARKLVSLAPHYIALPIGSSGTWHPAQESYGSTRASNLHAQAAGNAASHAQPTSTSTRRSYRLWRRTRECICLTL